MDNVNIGPKVLIANWTEAGIATVVVCIRMFTQIKVVGRVGIDDYLILLALVSNIRSSSPSLTTKNLGYRINQHITDYGGHTLGDRTAYSIFRACSHCHSHQVRISGSTMGDLSTHLCEGVILILFDEIYWSE